MTWWIDEEIEKYAGKEVIYQEKVCIVKEVFWMEQDEEFVYYIEDEEKKLYKVFENQITLVEL